MTNSTQPQPPKNPLRSVHTSNFPAILTQLNLSLVISTYQAGKLIIVRPDYSQDPPGLNTHFATFQKPMGMAGDQNRLALGSGHEVWHLRNMPAVAAKLEPAGQHDAYYLPHKMHVTGDIDIHEMSFGREVNWSHGPGSGDRQHAGDGPLRAEVFNVSSGPSPARDAHNTLWIVNTKFCCLCTLDNINSFVPRWRPHFVSALTPEDRCHLNGLGMVDGVPTFVTALGATDTPGGWRENKRNGGVLMHVPTNQVLLRGLSMPHSPRWYRDQLWLLESGKGTLARVHIDAKHPDGGTLETVAELPGFTRGLDFYGPLAFVGLSQVRETATFSDIPLVERLDERICGVWVIHIETGEVVAFLRFEDAVQEIFAVQVLPGICHPHIFDWGDERIKDSYVLPDAALREVPGVLVSG